MMLMNPQQMNPRIKQVKCNKCPKLVDCNGMTQEEMTTAMESVIETCKFKARTDFMECGLKKNLRVVTNFYRRKDVGSLLTPTKSEMRIPVFGKTADSWPHAKSDAERAAEIDAAIREAVEDPPWETVDTCGIDWSRVQRGCSSIMRNDGFKVLGKAKDSDELEIEIPDPIRILVSKKGHVTVIDSE